MLPLMKIKIVWARAHPLVLAGPTFWATKLLCNWEKKHFLGIWRLQILTSWDCKPTQNSLQICRQTSVPFAAPSKCENISKFSGFCFFQCSLSNWLFSCAVSLVIRIRVSKTTKSEDVGWDKLFWGCNQKRVRRWNRPINRASLSEQPQRVWESAGWGSLIWDEGREPLGFQGSAIFLMSSFGVHPPGMQQGLVRSPGLYKPDAGRLENLRHASRGSAKERETNAQATSKRWGEGTCKDAKQRLGIDLALFPNGTCLLKTPTSSFSLMLPRS